MSETVRGYGNWRKPSTAGVFGLGQSGTVLLFLGAFTVIVVMMFAPLYVAASVAAGVALVLLLLLVRDASGQNLATRGLNGLLWMRTVMEGANVYRASPIGRGSKDGSNRLPGLGSTTEVTEHYDSFRRPFAMLRLRARGQWSYTVVIGTEPDGAALVDQDQIDSWVAKWGHYLARLGREPGLEAASVTVETAPDPGTRLTTQLAAATDADAPSFALDVLEEVAVTYPASSSTVRAYVALTFKGRTRGRERDHDAVARDLASRIYGLTSALEATGAGASAPLSASQLAEVVRVAYSPTDALLFEQARAQGDRNVATWSDAGPMAADAHYSWYRHDEAKSITWSMIGAPEGIVQADVLAPLLAPHPDILRKRVTMLYRPKSPAEAAKIVDRDVAAASFRNSAKRAESARASRAVRAAQATAQEEAQGAGLVNFGTLITATVLEETDLSDAAAMVDDLAAEARLRIRRMYGSQDSGFLGALPIGLVLAKFMAAPSLEDA